MIGQKLQHYRFFQTRPFETLLDYITDLHHVSRSQVCWKNTCKLRFIMFISLVWSCLNFAWLLHTWKDCAQYALSDFNVSLREIANVHSASTINLWSRLLSDTFPARSFRCGIIMSSVELYLLRLVVMTLCLRYINGQVIMHKLLFVTLACIKELTGTFFDLDITFKKFYFIFNIPTFRDKAMSEGSSVFSTNSYLIEFKRWLAIHI